MKSSKISPLRSDIEDPLREDLRVSVHAYNDTAIRLVAILDSDELSHQHLLGNLVSHVT